MEAIYVVAIAMYVIMGIITFGIKLQLNEDIDSMFLVFTIGFVFVMITWPYLLGMLIGSYTDSTMSLLISINRKIKD